MYYISRHDVFARAAMPKGVAPRAHGYCAETMKLIDNPAAPTFPPQGQAGPHDPVIASVLPVILAVDDDPAIRQLIAAYLGDNELRVITAATGAEMEKALEEYAVDLVVLDLRLPDEDGMQLARRLRGESAIPIVILTGRQDEADRIMGLELGADDYLTKPFSPRELLARIRAVLRRYRTAREVLPGGDAAPRAYRFAGWELNTRTRRLTALDGGSVELTNGEFSLLQAFCAAPQRVLSREQLLDLSRLHGAEVYDRSIDVQILRLRRKIEANPSRPAYIRTERGIGYFFSVPVQIVH
jgi:DNA-binding response OmpR family regulator